VCHQLQPRQGGFCDLLQVGNSSDLIQFPCCAAENKPFTLAPENVDLNDRKCDAAHVDGVRTIAQSGDIQRCRLRNGRTECDIVHYNLKSRIEQGVDRGGASK